MDTAPVYALDELIARRYRVLRHMSGGICDVYLCRDERSGLPIAIKTPQESSEMRADRRERRSRRFQAESAIWATLADHPNVVRCHYVTADGDRPLVCMEWIDPGERAGAGLGRLLRQRGALPPAEAVRLAAGACRGLLHLQAHHRGFVHRDIKPENILVTQEGTPKVTDFGFSLMRGLQLRPAYAAVSDSSIVGTPPYMAPEQWTTGLVDEMADVYGLGLVLYEMIEGRRPFAASERSEWRQLHREAEFPEAVSAPAPLRAIIARCLAKDLAERPSVAELLSQLESLHVELTGEALPAAPAATEASARTLNNRGNSFYHLGLRDEALAAYDEALAADPALHQAQAGRGLVFQARGDSAAALAAYDAALELEPAYAWAHANRAALLHSLGRTAEAIEGSSRAITFAPELPEAWLNRGIARLASGDRAGAAADFEGAIERDGPREAFVFRARLAAEDRDFALAFTIIERLASRQPLKADEELDQGRWLSECGRHREAVSAFTRALSLGSDPVESHRLRGSAYSRAGRAQDAIEDFSTAIHLDPADSRAFRLRAGAYRDAGRLVDAIGDYARAIELAEDDASAYYELALVLGQKGEFDQANKVLEAAARRGSLDALRAQRALESRERALLRTVPSRRIHR